MDKNRLQLEKSEIVGDTTRPINRGSIFIHDGDFVITHTYNKEGKLHRDTWRYPASASDEDNNPKELLSEFRALIVERLKQNV